MLCPNLNELPPPPPHRTGWPWTEGGPGFPEKMPNGSGWPIISIVTPSYNQGQFLEETIRSVLLQGYPNIEYIIMDGGSTDKTLSIIHKYEPWLTYWVSEPDGGQSDAINKGWKKSTGVILAWLNSDDTYRPEALLTVAEIFGDQQNVVLVGGAGNTFNVSGTANIAGKVFKGLDPYAMLKRSGGVPMQPSIFLRRRVLDDVGYLNTQLHLVMDWEYWIRIGLYYEPEHFRGTNKVLSNNREWKGTKTNTAWRKVCEEHRQVFDAVFNKSSSDTKLEQIKRRAYSASYRKQAILAKRNKKFIESTRSLIWAWYWRLRYFPLSRQKKNKIKVDF